MSAEVHPSAYDGQPVISIDRDACRRDGLCVKLCPVRVFEMTAGRFPTISHTEECCLCGQCVAGCATGALHHSGFDPSELRQIERQVPLPAKAAYEFLSQRRSVRNYRKEVPPRELLEEIMEVAAYAPGSPNHRVGWVRSFIVVSGEENMREVLGITAEYVRRLYQLVNGLVVRTAARFDEAARAAIEVAPDLAMRLREYEAGRDAILYGAPAAIFAHAPVRSSFPQIDCDAAMYSALLMAHGHGLGTCWNGLLQGAASGDHLRGFTQLRDFLKIPRGDNCYAAATIGYPSVKLHRVPHRKVAIAWIDGG